MTDSTPAERQVSTLNHYGFYRFKNQFLSLQAEEKQKIIHQFIDELDKRLGSVSTFLCQPSDFTADFVIWTAEEYDSTEKARTFFIEYNQALNTVRPYFELSDSLWGFTKPSQYSRGRSAQELDPFSPRRLPYLIIYPFVKTKDWYLMKREARQGMMNEHIRVGKEHPDITQLLLYSFGVQNQEFVVVYETEDLKEFSNLVYELRDTQVRLYTERDTPLHTLIYIDKKDFAKQWN